ncbi:hypothetical protein ACJX0J_030684, partial [Zea mays]
MGDMYDVVDRKICAIMNIDTNSSSPFHGTGHIENIIKMVCLFHLLRACPAAKKIHNIDNDIHEGSYHYYWIKHNIIERNLFVVASALGVECV